MTRCLLVDDDPEIRMLLLDYLTRFGLQAEAVPDGAALRARLPRGGIDVLLLDLMLPDDDGLSLCQWVKQKQPQLPVIMLTAQGDPLSRVSGSNSALTTTCPSRSSRANWWRASRRCCAALVAVARAQRRRRCASDRSEPCAPT